MAERRHRIAEYLALLLGAGVYFAWGCGLGLELSDEGQIVFASWRTAEGSIPYRDFTHLYGPSLFFLNGALLRWFGDDLLIIRISLAILKSFTAVFVYACARLVASRLSSLLAYSLVLGMWGTPWVFNTPYSNHYALTLTMGGIVVFAASSRRSELACFLAGICFGLAATFKQTTGAFAVLWFALFLLAETNPSQPASPSLSMKGTPLVARCLRWMVLLGSLGTILAYQSTGTTAWNVLVISGPLFVTIVFLSVREVRGRVQSEQYVGSALRIASCAAGASIPVLAYAALYAGLGRLHDLVFNMVSLGTMVRWFVPFRFPEPRTLICILAIVTVFLTVRLWRAPASAAKSRRSLAAGLTVLVPILLYLVWDGTKMPGGAWKFLRTGAWYADVFRITYFLPLGVVLVALPTIFREAGGRTCDKQDGKRASARRLLFFAAAGSLLSLHPAADLWHVLMAVPMFLPVLSWQLDRFRWVAGSNGTAGRLLSASLVVLFGAILAAPFVHATVRARVGGPPAELSMKRATGIGLAPSFADRVELVSYLEMQSKDRGLLVLTNEQLLYFLSDRVPVLEEQEFILYLVGGGLIGDEDAKALVPEGPFVERLKATIPIIVDAVDNRTVRRFRDVFPNVARFIDENYRLEKSIGAYRILEQMENQPESEENLTAKTRRRRAQNEL